MRIDPRLSVSRNTFAAHKHRSLVIGSTKSLTSAVGDRSDQTVEWSDHNTFASSRINSSYLSAILIDEDKESCYELFTESHLKGSRGEV